MITMTSLLTFDKHFLFHETLRMCGILCVLFDNKTKDPTKRSNQVQKLLSLVNMVSENNREKPYINELFTEFKVKLIIIMIILIFLCNLLDYYDN